MWKQNYTKTLFIIILFIPNLVSAQNSQAINPSCGCPYSIAEQNYAQEEELLLHVDEKAQFKGGEKALRRFESYVIQKPARNQSDSLNYSIICHFVVERDGTISNIQLLNQNEREFELAARKIIEQMPKWIPAKKDKKEIRSWQTIKLFFGK